MAISDTTLRRISGKPYNGPEEIPDGGGLSVRISPKGLISFQFRFRFNDKPCRMKLGTYGKMSIKEAREAAAACSVLLDEGKNPSIQKKMRLQAAMDSPNISTLVDEWLESPQAVKLVKHEYWKRLLKLHVTDGFGKMLVDDMRVVHWEKIFRKITAGGSPVMAGMVLVKMKQVINYALRRERISNSSLGLLTVPDVGEPISARKRHLNDHEIGLFWNAVPASNLTLQNKLLLKLALLTGARGVELRKSIKGDFNLEAKTWLVRKEISKTRQAFTRGLSSEAVELLREAFSIYPDLKIVFPPARLQEDRPMSASVLISLVSQVSEIMGISDWGFHDFRRTCKTKMSEMGIEHHVSEKILGHKLTGMLAVYDQHEYIREQQEAADLWAAKIHSCAAEIPMD